MASYTLDDIREAAEKKYSSTDIVVDDTTVELVNPVRLPKEKRTALMSVLERLDNEDSEEDVDQESVLREAVRLAARTQHQADVLLAAIGDDLAVMVETFQKYTESQQVGEA